MKLLNKLEDFKKVGMYDVSLVYGENIGCDDLDIEMMKRSVKVFGTPVGVLGEAKTMFIGNVDSFLEFDVTTVPNRISNPPKREEYKEKGFYIWGTDSAVDSILTVK